MISAVVKEYMPQGQWCRLAPGTLDLVRVPERETATFIAQAAMDEGEELPLIPLLDSRLLLIDHRRSLPVAGAMTFPGPAAAQTGE